MALYFSRHSIDEQPQVSTSPKFEAAFPFQKDVLSLPVTDIDAAAQWYSKHFGMREVERLVEPVPTVILERDGIELHGVRVSEPPPNKHMELTVKSVTPMPRPWRMPPVAGSLG